MQQFQDLPLPITAGAGAAIVLILALVIVLVRRSRAAGDPARATVAKPHRKTRPPKPPKKVRMSRSERRRARRAMKHGSGMDDTGEIVAATAPVAGTVPAAATPGTFSATADDRDVSPAGAGTVTPPSVDAKEPVAATPGDPTATESIWEPPVTTDDEIPDSELTAPIAMREALPRAESPVVVSSAQAIPIEDPEYDPASVWMTADSNDVRWTNEASDAPASGGTGDIPAVPGSPDEWPTGSWESIEKLLPEAPQVDIGWGDAWDPDEPAADPVGRGGPEIPASTADGLDWSALGTVDADLPHDEWAAEALVREATVDAAREGSPADALTPDAAPDSPWEPVETLSEPPRHAVPAPEEPSVWPTTTPSLEDDGTTSPSPVTADVAATTSAGETGDVAAPPVAPGASTVSVGSVGGTPVVIDLATLAGLGGSMELVIEPNDDGNGLRLHLAQRDDVDGAPPPSPAADVAQAAMPDAASPVRGSAPQPSTPAVTASTDPLGAEPLPVTGEESADAPATSPRPTTAVNGWWNASAPAADADRVGARAPVPAEGDPDPARILADIRARLAALDARRNGDVPPI